MPTKKSPVKKAPAKKKSPVKKSNSPKKAKVAAVRTGRIAREQEAFMTFRINRETVYWLVLGLVAILFTIWLMQLQLDIQMIYDEIDASTAVDITDSSPKR